MQSLDKTVILTAPPPPLPTCKLIFWASNRFIGFGLVQGISLTSVLLIKAVKGFHLNYVMAYQACYDMSNEQDKPGYHSQF